MSQADRGAMGERLELKLIDGKTCKIKRHLVVAGGRCFDLMSKNLASEIRSTQQLLDKLLLKELSGKSE